MTSTTIIGAGAVGSFFAALLSQRGDTTLVSCSGRIRPDSFKEIVVSGALTTRSHSEKLTLATSLSPLSPGYVFITVKAYQLENLLSELNPLLSPDHIVIVCSNGLGIYLDARRIISPAVPLLRCVCEFGVTPAETHAVVLSGSPPAVTIAGPSELQPLALELATTLGSLGFASQVSTSIDTIEWEKAAINAVVNSVCTILGTNNGALLNRPSLKPLCAEVLKEIAAVAHSNGVALDHLSIDEFFERVSRFAANINSTLQDLRLGRPSEMSFILGRIIERAVQNSVAAPRLSLLWDLLQAL